jgi:hypothetical protein
VILTSPQQWLYLLIIMFVLTLRPASCSVMMAVQ